MHTYIVNISSTVMMITPRCAYAKEIHKTQEKRSYILSTAHPTYPTSQQIQHFSRKSWQRSNRLRWMFITLFAGKMEIMNYEIVKMFVVFGISFHLLY